MYGEEGLKGAPPPGAEGMAGGPGGPGGFSAGGYQFDEDAARHIFENLFGGGMGGFGGMGGGGGGGRPGVRIFTSGTPGGSGSRKRRRSDFEGEHGPDAAHHRPP